MGGAEGAAGRSQEVARGGRAGRGELSAAALTGPPRWLHPSARRRPSGNLGGGGGSLLPGEGGAFV